MARTRSTRTKGLEHVVLPLLLAVPGLASMACDKTPEEPAGTVNEVSDKPVVSPLTWTKPPSWTEHPSPKAGARKATYRTPLVGENKSEPEVWVMFFGTGADGDVEKNLATWYKQFDGDPRSIQVTGSFDVGSMKVRTWEWPGTYKLPLGPDKGPSPMQMVRKDYRLLGAVVETPDRGNWFFRMVGPDDSVKAARGDFETMLRSVK